MINRLSHDNFHIVCHIEAQFALSAKGCPKHFQLRLRLTRSTPMPRYGRQYGNCYTIISKHTLRYITDIKLFNRHDFI